MKDDPVQSALAQLDDYDPSSPEGRRFYGKALTGKWSLVSAKAARRIGEAQCRDYMDQLAAVFGRCIEKGPAFDKGCAAALAIARTLVNLECDNADLFLRGMKHVQREPVWGGSVDTAAELRAACAMGFVNSSYRDKLRYLVDLLVDAEWVARAGAIRAIAAVGSESAALILRYKALLGDPEAEVLSECLSGLLEIGGEDALELARTISFSFDPQVAEAAILALGASRREDAIAFLTARYDETADRALKKCILLSLASSRVETAIRFLLTLVGDGDAGKSAAAVAALAIHRGDARIQQAVEAALAARGN